MAVGVAQPRFLTICLNDLPVSFSSCGKPVVREPSADVSEKLNLFVALLQNSLNHSSSNGCNFPAAIRKRPHSYPERFNRREHAYPTLHQYLVNVHTKLHQSLPSCTYLVASSLIRRVLERRSSWVLEEGMLPSLSLTALSVAALDMAPGTSRTVREVADAGGVHPRNLRMFRIVLLDIVGRDNLGGTPTPRDDLPLALLGGGSNRSFVQVAEPLVNQFSALLEIHAAQNAVKWPYLDAYRSIHYQPTPFCSDKQLHFDVRAYLTEVNLRLHRGISTDTYLVASILIGRVFFNRPDWHLREKMIYRLAFTSLSIAMDVLHRVRVYKLRDQAIAGKIPKKELHQHRSNFRSIICSTTPLERAQRPMWDDFSRRALDGQRDFMGQAYTELMENGL